MEDRDEVATKGYVSAEVEKLANMVAGGFDEVATKTELRIGLVGLENSLVFRMDMMESRLESKIDGLGSRIDGLGSRMDGFGSRMDGLEQKMATKDDLSSAINSLEQRMTAKMATKDDLKRFATKLDLEAAVGKLARIVKDALDEMASRTEVRDLRVRVEKLEAKPVI
jgi:hypothetical protein